LIPVARLGDRTIGDCYAHDDVLRNVGGTIVTCSPDDSTTNRGTARLGDLVLSDCGHYGIICTSSSLKDVNQRGIARIGDTTSGDYVAYIITGSNETSCS
jgi:uncharacterized Zn-binding protein involved in type VI secretion